MRRRMPTPAREPTFVMSAPFQSSENGHWPVATPAATLTTQAAAMPALTRATSLSLALQRRHAFPARQFAPVVASESGPSFV